MARVARLESSLAFNDAEFTTGIARAEQRAATFSSRVSKNFQNLFRRERGAGRRTEVALTELLGGLQAGTPAQALAGFAARITGLGIAAGVGIGAAVEGFRVLHDHINETKKAEEELQETLSKPVSLVVSSGGTDQFIASLKKQGDEVGKQFGSTTQQILDSFKFGPLQSKAENDEALRRRQEIADSEEKINQAARERGQLELSLAKAKSDTSDSGRLSELYFKMRGQEAGLRLNQDKGTPDRLEALKITEEFLTDQVAERTEARDREFESAKKLLNLERSGLPEETKKRIEANIRLGGIDEDLKGRTLSPEQRQKLELDQLRQRNLLRSAKPKNPYAWGTIANREWEDKNGGFGSVASREAETNDPTKWGSLAWSAAQRGETASSDNMTPDIVEELVKLNQNFDKYWGPN